MKNERVGLFPAKAAVIADEFFHRGNGAIGIESADDGQVAIMRKFRQTFQLCCAQVGVAIER